MGHAKAEMMAAHSRNTPITANTIFTISSQSTNCILDIFLFLNFYRSLGVEALLLVVPDISQLVG